MNTLFCYKHLCVPLSLWDPAQSPPEETTEFRYLSQATIVQDDTKDDWSY